MACLVKSVIFEAILASKSVVVFWRVAALTNSRASPSPHSPRVIGKDHMKKPPAFIIKLLCSALGLCALQGQSGPNVHQGQYQKNLTYKGALTGDQITYTLYLPPGYRKEKKPLPLIVFLHGAGGGNSSSEVMMSYEAAREAGTIGNFAVLFPEKYAGTVWRDGAREKRPETNILRELLPYLQKKHSLTNERGQRTVMGFSMGAAGSLYWGAKYLDLFSTAVALDAGGGTSFTDNEARNYVPDYGKKSVEIRKSLRIRLVQGALNTRRFRQSLDQLKIPYDYDQLPRDVASYPAGSSCLNRKDPAKKFLHNPACMTEGTWGRKTWGFIEKGTLRKKLSPDPRP